MTLEQILDAIGNMNVDCIDNELVVNKSDLLILGKEISRLTYENMKRLNTIKVLETKIALLETEKTTYDKLSKYCKIDRRA